MKNKYRKYTQKINSLMTYGDKLWVIQRDFSKTSFREMSKLKFQGKRDMHRCRDKRHSYIKNAHRNDRVWKREVLNHFKVKEIKDGNLN